MFRDFLIGLSLVIASTGAFAAESTLTGKTLIDGDRVTVGDLFTNSGRHAEYALAPAPKVGEKLSLSKEDLLRVADTFHLDWTPPAEDLSVSLQRNAVMVDAQKVANALGQSDLKDKISDGAAFQVTNLDQPLVFQGLEEPTLTISDATFDPDSEKFAAIITITRDGATLKELTVKGNATPMASIPVLRHTVVPNVSIGRDDLTMLSLPRRDVRSGSFMTVADVIGMSAKRTLSAGQAISQNDVTPPLMVKRNELITVFYANGPVRLSTKARALDNGAKGETVTLENTTSKKPFQAKITGPNQAEVLLDSING